MKRIIRAAMLALCLLSFTVPPATTAQSREQLAQGNFWFTTEDGVTRFVEFSALKNSEGVTTGAMSFNDTSRIADDDSDGDPPPKPRDGPTELYVKAEFDAMTVDKDPEGKGGVVAIMSGVVRDSSHQSYIGRWVQLVVVDNAENPRLPDQLTWSFCRPEPGGWVPSDAERKTDNGAYMSWWATDAERKDDVGIPSKNLIPGMAKGCYVYNLPAYSYVAMEKWEGDIVVRY